MHSVGICSNVDLRTLGLSAAGASLTYMETAIARTSLALDREFWSGADSFLVFLDPVRVLPAGRVTSADDAAVVEWFSDRALELASTAREFSDRLFVIVVPAAINDTLDADCLLAVGRDDQLERCLREKLQETLAGLVNVVLLDWPRLLATHGAATLYDDKYWYLGRMPLSGAGARVLWHEFNSLLAMIRGTRRKVLCLDLDNTLWRGICGEEGPTGVGISEEGVDKAYRDLQRAVLALKGTGILLAINSKNNPQDALAVIRDNPMMLLREGDFAAARINWNDKSANLLEMAAELGLGVDSFVFVDDSHVEREMMRRALPDVAVPEFPAEPSDLPAWFREHVVRSHFRFRNVTEEDRGKTEQYRLRQARAQQSAALPAGKAIEMLGMELTVEPGQASSLARMHQMAQKTNQFNLTTRRYSESELADRIRSPEYSVWTARYKDKFGDEGIVAMAVVARREPRLESFLLSCRVIGRGVEFAFLGEICAALRADSFRTLQADFIETPKNGPSRDFLTKAGFEGDGQHFVGAIDALVARLAGLAAGITTSRMEPAT